ncbi:hypothetical protein AAEX28_04220 [Lentisphaerota bacterium WC36G]|nr:hypothetical protein LJT99_07090 [Lentisphaerae bacterium WC36]
MTRIQKLITELKQLDTAIAKCLANGGVISFDSEGVKVTLSLEGLYNRRDKLENKIRRITNNSGRNFIV